MIRTKAVDGLCSALEKDGFLPIRDRDQMHNGELISAFIRRLTRADHAVAIISDKYLRSPYCMFEIYNLWQRSLAEGEDMAQRVVPVVLPEVKINGAVERAPYVKHWINQAKTLEKLIRDLGINASRKTQQEARLVREFAHHIDDILVFLNDVLMPRQLEVHLDNDFQAVREALRRRLARKDS
jgi:internalin A